MLKRYRSSSRCAGGLVLFQLLLFTQMFLNHDFYYDVFL